MDQSVLIKWMSVCQLRYVLFDNIFFIIYHLYVVLKRNTHGPMQIVYILIRHHMCRGLSFHAGTTFLDIFGLSFFPKRIYMNRFCPTSQTYACQIKHRTSHFDVTFELTYRLSARATSVRQQLEAAFLNREILLIPSFQ